MGRRLADFSIPTFHLFPFELLASKKLVPKGLKPCWMDEILPQAPPNSETLESETLVNTKQQWFCMVSKWCEMDFAHPQYGGGLN